MKKDRDAYGAELWAQYQALGVVLAEIVERKDGFIAASPWPPRYFSDYPDFKA